MVNSITIMTRLNGFVKIRNNKRNNYMYLVFFLASDISF